MTENTGRLNQAADQWLTARGVDLEIADRYGLESVSRSVGEWISIPFIRNGEVVNRKYRRIDEKGFSQDKGGDQSCVWNEDCLRDPALGGPVIITEGEWDAMAALTAGFERVVSVPSGAPAEAVGDRDTRKYAFVETLLKLVPPTEQIILATDWDGPGFALRDDLSIRLGKARCKFAVYPKGCKDLNDALIEFGGEDFDRGIRAVKESIRRAKNIEIHDIARLSELPPEPPLTVYRAGFTPEMDSHLGFVRGHFSVWTGIPGHGKSLVVNTCVANLCRANAWTAAMAMFEGSPQGPFRRDIARWFCGKPWRELDPEEWAQVDAFIEEHFMFVVPGLRRTDDGVKTEAAPQMSLDWLLEKLEAIVTREGAQIAVVDPWSKLDHEFSGLDETNYTSHCIKLLQRFAQRFDVHVAVVAHPRKLDLKTREAHREPTGYDVSGSAAWFNHPDLGVTVHRPVDDKHKGSTMVRVWKSKNHDEMGKPGAAYLRFNSMTGQFYTWDNELESVAA